jgi:hypothetical protein
MRKLILATASVLALGITGSAVTHAADVNKTVPAPGSAMSGAYRPESAENLSKNTAIFIARGIVLPVLLWQSNGRDASETGVAPQARRSDYQRVGRGRVIGARRAAVGAAQPRSEPRRPILLHQSLQGVHDRARFHQTIIGDNGARGELRYALSRKRTTDPPLSYPGSYAGPMRPAIMTLS